MSGTKPNLNKKRGKKKKKSQAKRSHLSLDDNSTRKTQNSTAQYRQKRANQPLPYQYECSYMYICMNVCVHTHIAGNLTTDYRNSCTFKKGFI